MRDINDLGINWPGKSFLHTEIEGLDGDEPGDDVHRNVQVLHGGKTITDVHGEDVSALEKDRGNDWPRASILERMSDLNPTEQNLDEGRHVKNAALVDVLLGEGVDVVEDRRGRGVRTVGQFDHMTMGRKALNGEHHFRRQNISLLHLN